jgi:hypothetical protein
LSTPWTAAASAGLSSPPAEEPGVGDEEEGAADEGVTDEGAEGEGAWDCCATGRKDMGLHPATRITKAEKVTNLDHIRQILPQVVTGVSADW